LVNVALPHVVGDPVPSARRIWIDTLVLAVVANVRRTWSSPAAAVTVPMQSLWQRVAAWAAGAGSTARVATDRAAAAMPDAARLIKRWRSMVTPRVGVCAHPPEHPAVST
jgi:hypothetical protein